MKLNRILLCRAFAVGAATIMGATLGCSKSDSTTTPSSDAPKSAVGYKATATALDSAGGMVPNTVSFLSSPVRAMTGISTPNDVWATGFLADPRCSGGASDAHCGSGAVSVGFKGLLGFMSDPDAVRDNGSSINIFGRLKKAMETGCAVTTLVSSQNGGTLPTSGTFTVKFTDAVKTTLSTYCNMTDVPDAGTEATVVITPTTDTTNYDMKIAVTVGGQNFETYLRNNDSEVNVAEGEDNGTNNSRTWVKYNRTTGVIRAEYVSYSSNSGGAGEFHRLYFDSANTVGAMVGASFDFNGSPNRYVFAIKGKPEVAGAQTAVSIGVVGFGLTGVDSGASTSALNHYKGCIDADSGSVVTNDTVSCSGGVTGADTSAGLGTLFTTFLTSLNGNGDGLIHSSVYGETKSLDFTSATDIFSTAIAIH